MGSMKLPASIVALALAATSLSAAAQTVTASPAAMVAALQKAGLSTNVKTPDTGAPYVESTTGGTTFAVFLLNCDNGRSCTTVQFFAGFPDSKPALSAINQWNSDNRFARAYLSDKGSARIEMDVDLDAGGMSTPLFADNIAVWIAIVQKYRKYIGS